jgi:hypothetical protein
MRLAYRWIKDTAGALDREFIALLASFFGTPSFVETGTYRGDTIAAVRGVFSSLISVELSPELAPAARQRFAGDHAVRILQADSAAGLGEALANLVEQPALVWLDAHYSGGGTAKGDRNTPILAEIDQILTCRDGRDVILVDDARLFWPVPSEFVSHETLQDYPLLSEVAERLISSSHAYQVHILGDALLATPAGLEISPLLAACTASRLALPGIPPDRGIEAIIVAASGSERLAITQLQPPIEDQKMYGLGGHYFYWRGLLREAEGAIEAAREDLLFAARCGVIPMGRVPGSPHD